MSITRHAMAYQFPARQVASATAAHDEWYVMRLIYEQAKYGRYKQLRHSLRHGLAAPHRKWPRSLLHIFTRN